MNRKMEWVSLKDYNKLLESVKHREKINQEILNIIKKTTLNPVFKSPDYQDFYYISICSNNFIEQVKVNNRFLQWLRNLDKEMDKKDEDKQVRISYGRGSK